MKTQLLKVILTCYVSLLGFTVQATTPAIDDNTFACIKDMTKVRGFYVDNLNKEKVADTVKIAQAGQGEYPEGSVVQLVPAEVMVKHKKGTSPATNDWEFFELNVSKNTTEIHVRGFEQVKNKFGGNCLDCHKKAKPEFDMICEQGHGCDPIPVTAQMTAVLQKTDPRCPIDYTLTEQEKLILAQLKAAFGQ